MKKDNGMEFLFDRFSTDDKNDDCVFDRELGVYGVRR